MATGSMVADMRAAPLVAAATHVGLVRHENEDAIAVNSGSALWAVADGMGGHANGAWASRQIADALETLVLSAGLDDDTETVADVLGAINDRIVAAAAEAGQTMGSTVVAVIARGDRFACLWAGDSRLYRVRDGALRQVSRDHSQVAELIAAGLLRPEDAESHPLANVVTRAVGTQPGLALDVIEDTVRDGDTLLLCSDGLSKCLTSEEMLAVLAGLPPDAACRALVAATMARGAPDNVSAILLRWGGEAGPPNAEG